MNVAFILRHRSAAAAVLAIATTFAPAPAIAASHRSSRPAEWLRLPSGLYPSFRPAVHDYVVRCDAARSLKVDLDAGVKRGTVTVKEGRRAWRSGHLKLRLRTDQELSVDFHRTRRSDDDYYVRCLPFDFPAFTFQAYGRLPDVDYVVAPTTSFSGGSYYVIVFDRHGVPVWWMKSMLPYDQQAFPDHTIGWWMPTATATNSGYVVRDLAGKVVHTWVASGAYTDLHEFQLLPNGDALLAGDVDRSGTIDLAAYGGPATGATLIEPVIEEVSPTGRLVWSWNVGSHLGPQDTDRAFWPLILSTTGQKLPGGRVAYDYAHLNSIQQLPDGKTLIVSIRHMSAVYAIDKQTGRILWKLGGNPSPESLKVIGDPQGQQPFSGQHDARMLPDGTLTVYDNNTLDGDPPRAVHYRINTGNMTATLIDERTNPLAASSGCCGSVAIEPDGSWLMSWANNPLITAVSPAGKQLFALTFPQGYFSYRAQEVPASWLPISDLRAGMDQMAAPRVAHRRKVKGAYRHRLPAIQAPLPPFP